MKANHCADPLRARCTLAALLLAIAIIPLTASAACTGKLGDLQSYAGKYRAHDDLLAAPAIAARLSRLPQETRLHLQRNLDVSGPVKLQACHLTITGNLPHQGGVQGAIFDVDLASGEVIAAIHDGGRINIYVMRDPAAGTRDASWNALPHAVREWAVRADSGFAQQHPRNLAQPASVRLHVPAGASPGTEAASSPARKIDFGKDEVKPTAAQAAAILRAATRASEKDLVDCGKADCYAMVLADINDDGRPDLLVQAQNMGYCGSAGCAIALVMATPHGYAPRLIDLAYAGSKLEILPGKHHGMHDLRYNGDSPPWQWNGKEYVINKHPSSTDDRAGSAPGSNAAPWKTAQAAGHPLTAYAAPVDSTIKHLLVSCQNGLPLLTMLTKQPRSTGPVTLTFVFNGWTLNLPMQRNIYNTNLWMSDLSRSELPEWLAHRGRDSTTNDLARNATQAFLRINGQMEGEISLANSTAATRAALQGCYRY